MFFIHIILKLLVAVDDAEDSSSRGKAGPSMSHCVKFLQGLRSVTSTVTNDRKDLSNSDNSHRSGHRQNFAPFRLRACPIIFSILLVTQVPPWLQIHIRRRLIPEETNFLISRPINGVWRQSQVKVPDDPSEY